MRVAIVRLTAMGDIIHTLSSAQFIKGQMPDIHITWFVEEKFAEILGRNPHIDSIVPVNMHGLKKKPSFSALEVYCSATGIFLEKDIGTSRRILL